MDIKIHKITENLKNELKKKIDLKTKPIGSLGKLEEIALKTGLVQNTLSPKISKPVLMVFVADHGIADSNVSAYPKEVTRQMVLNFLNGGAAVNVFAQQNNFELRIIDAGVDFDFKGISGLTDRKIAYGTKNMLIEPAMSADECFKAVESGKTLVLNEFNNGSNTVAFGEMGIGNTSSASLLMSRLLDLPIEQCTGRGAGIDDNGFKRKLDLLKEVINKYGSSKDPIEVLRTFGGFEIAMVTGAALKAAELGMLIIVDGFIISSAILVAASIDSNVLEYCLFSHLSDEKAHKQMLDKMHVEPILQLGMRLGEGSGAAVCLPIIQSAVNFLNKMASFEDAGVSNKEN